MSRLRIGVDLGGTKIEAVALAADGRFGAPRRVRTPRGDYAGTVSAIADLVHELERDNGGTPALVGVGIPGTLSPRTGLVKNANSTWLIGHPLDRDLAAVLCRQDGRPRPVRLENDANCFAVSEAADGAGVGGNVVFGVILGTGCGGGIAIDGRPMRGRNAIAGEWGHNPLPWPRADELPGPACYCGKSGCLETWVSGPGFAADHARATGRTLTAEVIVGQAADGDAAAIASVERLADRLARGLTTVINSLDPDVIVLGGGVSNIAVLYDRLPRLIAGYAFSDGIDTPIRRAKHGDSSGVRGAAWLWPTALAKACNGLAI